MSTEPRWPRDGDWFTVPLPDGGLAVGHAVVVVENTMLLGYFFSTPEAPTLESCRQWAPRDAFAAILCGGMGLSTGEWALLGTDPVDRRSWPIPEFERTQPTGRGERLLAITKDAGLRTINAIEVPYRELGSRQPDGSFGYIAAARYLQGRLNAGASPVGDQPWWDRRVGHVESSSDGARTANQRKAVLLQVPADWSGDLEELVQDLERALPKGSEVDGTLRSPTEATVYMYGPDPERIAKVVKRAIARHDLPADTVLEIPPGPSGCPNMG